MTPNSRSAFDDGRSHRPTKSARPEDWVSLDNLPPHPHARRREPCRTRSRDEEPVEEQLSVVFLLDDCRRLFEGGMDAL